MKYLSFFGKFALCHIDPFEFTSVYDWILSSDPNYWVDMLFNFSIWGQKNAKQIILAFY